MCRHTARHLAESLERSPADAEDGIVHSIGDGVRVAIELRGVELTGRPQRRGAPHAVVAILDALDDGLDVVLEVGHRQLAEDGAHRHRAHVPIIVRHAPHNGGQVRGEVGRVEGRHRTDGGEAHLGRLVVELERERRHVHREVGGVEA